ncbi:hypothetical protein D9M71_591780 [compost metagenome]
MRPLFPVILGGAWITVLSIEIEVAIYQREAAAVQKSTSLDMFFPMTNLRQTESKDKRGTLIKFHHYFLFYFFKSASLLNQTKKISAALMNSS